MATRAIGLDIGTFAVRAAEVVVGNSGVRVVRFGQLTLPPGAVVAGEVVDTDAVAVTLRRLWERVGFRSRHVVLGVANQRVLVRQTDLPVMSDEDLAAALQFQDTDVLPVSAEDARVDFQRLEEFVSEEGERVRLLLASAELSMLNTHLQAAELAGLRVMRVDPMPLALVRSIGRTSSLLEDQPSSEALVCVGAGVTTIVVHENGLPRFARFLTEGAGAATDAVALELGVDLDTAEDLKRRAGTGADEVADVAVSRVVVRLVDDIDNSIRFHMSQESEVPVGRIVLAGAGSRLAGLATRLAATTGLPVEPAHPSRLFEVDAGLTEEEIARAEPNLPSVIGLALAAVPLGVGERRINLLPAALAEVKEVRTRALVAGLVLVALALLLVAIWAVRGHQLSHVKSQEAGQASQVQFLQKEITALGNNGSAQAQVARYTQMITSTLAGDVDWAGLLTQVANAMPNDVWLVSFSGSANPSAGTGPSPPSPTSLGTVSFSAMGFNQTSTARWLSDVAQLDSLSQLWVSTSTRGGPQGLVSFSSQADLASGALSDRVGQFTGQGQ